METYRSRPLSLGLIVLAVLFAILAVLYAAGTISFLARTQHTHHYTHAVVMGALAVASLIAANFARPR